MRLPASVLTTVPSGRMRILGVPCRSRCARVAPWANGRTSMATAQRSPTRVESLVSSTMMTFFFAAKFTIFSRVCAAPPPLTRSSAALTSSAPSTLTSMDHGPSSPSRGMPQRVASARVSSDVGTPVTRSPARTRSASSSTKRRAVEPLPRPMIPPLAGTSSRAARAAARLGSRVIGSSRPRSEGTPPLQAPNRDLPMGSAKRQPVARKGAPRSRGTPEPRPCETGSPLARARMEAPMLTFGWRQFDDTIRALDVFQRRIDEAYDDWSTFGVRPRHPVHGIWPALNAFETKETFVYKAEVPGLAEGDVSVYVEDDTLILRGERKSAVPDGYQVHLRERQPAAFSRKVTLPGRVDGEAVTATLKDGVLTITLPQAQETLPRQIAVKAG